MGPGPETAPHGAGVSAAGRTPAARPGRTRAAAAATRGRQWLPSCALGATLAPSAAGSVPAGFPDSLPSRRGLRRRARSTLDPA